MSLLYQKTGLADLPAPGADAEAHSRQLIERIIEEIQRGGDHISFRRFMEMALYEPGLGYYSGGTCKFGDAGDFITAPEISPLFSYCLARQCAQILRSLPGVEILELGAGTGIMAADLLKELRRLDTLPDRYLILETSADLRARQRQTIATHLPELLPRVEWLDSLPRRPVTGVILANEVLDAMPVQRINCIDGVIHEMHVCWREGEFNWLPCQAGTDLMAVAQERLGDMVTELPAGYTTEINLGLQAWMAAVADSLNAGAILFADYGYTRSEYYHPQRSDGTLLCHYRHHAHGDPFFRVGLQDITASVDFTAVAEAALDAGMHVSGFTTQAHFLLACGLDEYIGMLAEQDERLLLKLGREAKLLTLPDEMGESFKFIGLLKDMQGPLTGFTLADHRYRL